jgi:hypothetical protein
VYFGLYYMYICVCTCSDLVLFSDYTVWLVVIYIICLNCIICHITCLVRYNRIYYLLGFNHEKTTFGTYSKILLYFTISWNVYFAADMATIWGFRFRFMMINATFNNISVWVISWRSILLVEDTRVPRENHQSDISHCSLCQKHFDKLAWTAF